MAWWAKNLPANAGDKGDKSLTLGSGRFPGEGNGNPLQYSCLEESHGPRSLGGPRSTGLQRVGHHEATKHACTQAKRRTGVSTAQDVKRA